MKINTLVIGLFVLLVSCGSEPKAKANTEKDPIFGQACECLDLAKVLQAELSKVTSSDEQMEVQEKYKEQIDACDKVIKTYSDGFTGLNEQEAKEREQRMGAVCPAYKDIPKQ